MGGGGGDNYYFKVYYNNFPGVDSCWCSAVSSSTKSVCVCVCVCVCATLCLLMQVCTDCIPKLVLSVFASWEGGPTDRVEPATPFDNDHTAV